MTVPDLVSTGVTNTARPNNGVPGPEKVNSSSAHAERADLGATTAYVDLCQRGLINFTDVVVREFLPAAYDQSYGARLLTRPLFAEHAQLAGFSDDLATIFTILTALTDRRFDGDLCRYCEALGMDERVAEVMTFGATAALPMYARADAFHDGTSFRLLEFNVGSELGGVDSAQLNRAFLQVGAFAEFADQHRLTYVDTSQWLANALRSAGATVTSGDPVVALLEAKGDLADYRTVYQSIAEGLGHYGITVLLGEIDQVSQRNGRLTLDGVPFDVVLRFFTSGQLLDDPNWRDSLGVIINAAADGRVAYFTPLAAGIYASKSTLALLHEPATRELLSPAEQDVVDRVVPWTRLLSRVSASAAEWTELVDHAVANQQGLVIKPGVGYSGEGVVIGRDVPTQAWRERLAAARGTDCVIQQLVRPIGEPVVDPYTGAVADWQANWGIFMTDEGYGGAFVRALKPADGSIISFGNPGTRAACVFTQSTDSPSG